MKRGWICLIWIFALVSLAGSEEIYCRYALGDHTYYGKVDRGIILQLDAAPWAGGQVTGHQVRVEQVKLLHPSEPTVIVGISGSYREAWEGKKPFKTIRWFLKPPSSAASPGDDVELPRALDELLVESELVVIIGKTVKNAGLEEAREAIFGYTAGNDIVGSATSYYKMIGDVIPASDPLLPAGLKIGDGFAPYGPYIYRGVDWNNRKRELVVTNPETGKQTIYQHNTSNFMFPPDKIVSDLSNVLTLHPGDVIFTGTTKALPAHVGDIMEVIIEGFTPLKNVVAPPRYH